MNNLLLVHCLYISPGAFLDRLASPRYLDKYRLPGVSTNSPRKPVPCNFAQVRHGYSTDHHTSSTRLTGLTAQIIVGTT
ncbi:hypothetical protein BX600DRAFT_460063 [Xylariales sp. PMI_506]|nr:hypothetical protein BX600DRAFT_460063 [Xylariales sp. PMI_506]